MEVWGFGALARYEMPPKSPVLKRTSLPADGALGSDRVTRALSSPTDQSFDGVMI